MIGPSSFLSHLIVRNSSSSSSTSIFAFLLFVLVSSSSIIRLADAHYYLPKEVNMENMWDQAAMRIHFCVNILLIEMLISLPIGMTTYVMNVTEYVNRMCDKRLKTYSKLDCDKVNSDEQRLLRQLMRNYEKDVRPVVNSSSIVVVKLGLTLTQIFDLAEKNQILISNVWLDIEWVDEFLRWDPNEFNGLKVLRIPSKKIWLPDLVLYNNAAEYLNYRLDTNAMIYYNGKVFWPVPTKLQSTCKFDVTFFPFDIQTCYIKIGSWTYDGFQVDITNRTENIELSSYVPNGEWELIKASLVRNVVYYPCCPEPFPDVTFMLKIKRRVLFFMINVIVPCIMLSTLTLLVFVIPPDSGDKVTLGITVLLAFSVFMLAVAENLPETSEYVPLISIYLTVIMSITSLSVICTVFVLNLYHRGPKTNEVPHWLRKLVLKSRRKDSSCTLGGKMRPTSYSTCSTASWGSQQQANGGVQQPKSKWRRADSNSTRYETANGSVMNHKQPNGHAMMSTATTMTTIKTSINNRDQSERRSFEREQKFPAAGTENPTTEGLYLTESRKNTNANLTTTSLSKEEVKALQNNKLKLMNSFTNNAINNNNNNQQPSLLLINSPSSKRSSMSNDEEELINNNNMNNNTEDATNLSVYEFVNLTNNSNNDAVVNNNNADFVDVMASTPDGKCRNRPTNKIVDSSDIHEGGIKRQSSKNASSKRSSSKRQQNNYHKYSQDLPSYHHHSSHYQSLHPPPPAPPANHVLNNNLAASSFSGFSEKELNFYHLFYDSIQRMKSINDIEEMEKWKIEEWKMVAAYFDKIFFWIFLIFTLLFSFVCLVAAPIYQYFKTY